MTSQYEKEMSELFGELHNARNDYNDMFFEEVEAQKLDDVELALRCQRIQSALADKVANLFGQLMNVHVPIKWADKYYKYYVARHEDGLLVITNYGYGTDNWSIWRLKDKEVAIEGIDDVTFVFNLIGYNVNPKDFYGDVVATPEDKPDDNQL